MNHPLLQVLVKHMCFELLSQALSYSRQGGPSTANLIFFIQDLDRCRRIIWIAIQPLLLLIRDFRLYRLIIEPGLTCSKLGKKREKLCRYILLCVVGVGVGFFFVAWTLCTPSHRLTMYMYRQNAQHWSQTICHHRTTTTWRTPLTHLLIFILAT